MSIAQVGCSILKVDEEGKIIIGPEKASIKVFEGEIRKEKPSKEDILSTENDLLVW